jgi:hypothetical protein
MDIIMECLVKNKTKELLYKNKLLKIDLGRLILIKNNIKK